MIPRGPLGQPLGDLLMEPLGDPLGEPLGEPPRIPRRPWGFSREDGHEIQCQGQDTSQGNTRTKTRTRVRAKTGRRRKRTAKKCGGRAQRSQENAGKQGTEARQNYAPSRHVFRGEGGGGVSVLPRAVNTPHFLPPPLAASLPPLSYVRTRNRSNIDDTRCARNHTYNCQGGGSEGRGWTMVIS